MVNHRRTYREYNKAYIDIANIVIAVLVVFFLGLTLFRVVRPMFFFPVIFYLGTLMNILSCVRYIIDRERLMAIFMGVISLIMLVISIYASILYWL